MRGEREREKHVRQIPVLVLDQVVQKHLEGRKSLLGIGFVGGVARVLPELMARERRQGTSRKGGREEEVRICVQVLNLRYCTYLDDISPQ